MITSMFVLWLVLHLGGSTKVRDFDDVVTALAALGACVTCLLAAKRSRQLLAGARPVQEGSRNKAPVLSLREVATGKVKFDRDLREALAGKFDAPKRA